MNLTFCCGLQNFILKVDNAAFAAVRDDSPEDFNAKLQSFTVNMPKTHFKCKANLTKPIFGTFFLFVVKW